MTNKEMESAIKWIREVKESESVIYRTDDSYIMNEMKSEGYTETEIRYCYVLATGKNMTI